jgi:hypothetical protein
MMAEYPTPPGDGMAPIVDEFRKLGRRISELERPSGTSIGSLVAQVQAALVDLNAAVIAATNNYLSSGTVNVTNLNASGTLSAVTQLKSLGAYTTDVAGLAGGRQSVWQHVSGVYGYSSSSIVKKTNLSESLPFTAADLLECTAYIYQYRAQIAIRDNPESEDYNPLYIVPTDVGFMAEHLIERGLALFVIFREGVPVTIDYALLGAVASIVIGQEHERKLASLEARLEKLEP